MNAAGPFRRIISRLDQVGIPYMLTGSFASAYHGSPRATQDIDLVIAPTLDQLRALVSSLPPSDEDVILSKLEWAKLGESERQLEDVSRLVQVRGNDLDSAYLGHWIGVLGVAREWDRARSMRP